MYSMNADFASGLFQFIIYVQDFASGAFQVIESGTPTWRRAPIEGAERAQRGSSGGAARAQREHTTGAAVWGPCEVI